MSAPSAKWIKAGHLLELKCGYTGKSPLRGLSGEHHMLFKAKLCQEEEKSAFLGQAEETEMGETEMGIGTPW